MRKRDELSNPASCLARARNEEMLFVLLGRDVASPTAIRAWVKERIRLGKNREGDEQTTSALECAKTMEQESKPKFEIESVAFETPVNRGFKVKASYINEPTSDALIEIFKDGALLRWFLFPSYKIWNIAAHFGEMVDEWVEQESTR